LDGWASYGACGALYKGDCSVFYRLIDMAHEMGLDGIRRNIRKRREDIRRHEMEAHGGKNGQDKGHVEYMRC